MDSPTKPSFADVRVGIFVVGACLLLAISIFTIGTSVGFLEKTFFAKTYLNNVSGLKPGDLVLLAGVEVGNVRRVTIAGEGLDSPTPLPETTANIENRARMDALNNGINETAQEIADRTSLLEELRADLDQALQQSGPGSAEVQRLNRQVSNQENALNQLRAQETRLRDEAANVQAQLQSIEVYMEISSAYRDWIREDSTISLGSIGLLGDKYIEISLGRSPNPTQTEIESYPTWFGVKDREVVQVAGSSQPGFEQLITGANDILANFRTLSNQLNDIMGTITRGEGSIGRFFGSPDFYDNLNQTVLSANRTIAQADILLQDLHHGKGTIPTLVQERELYDRINAAAAAMKEIVAEVEAGDGTLGRLVKDEAIYESANEMLRSAEVVTRRIAEGQGTLGQLSKDDAVYRDLKRSLEQLADFIEAVEEGEGTLGRLAKDEALYSNLNEVSSEVVKLIYDFRQNPRKFLTIKFEIF